MHVFQVWFLTLNSVTLSKTPTVSPYCVFSASLLDYTLKDHLSVPMASSPRWPASLIPDPRQMVQLQPGLLLFYCLALGRWLPARCLGGSTASTLNSESCTPQLMSNIAAAVAVTWIQVKGLDFLKYVECVSASCFATHLFTVACRAVPPNTNTDGNPNHHHWAFKCYTLEFLSFMAVFR